MPTTPMDASFFAIWCTSYLDARVNITKTNRLVKRVDILIKMKRIPSTGNVNIHCSFDHTLEPIKLAKVQQHAEKVQVQPVHEESIKTLWLPPYYPKTVHWDKYDHMTSVLDAVQIPRDLLSHEFDFQKEVLYICITVWKTARVEQMFHSGML